MAESWFLTSRFSKEIRFMTPSPGWVEQGTGSAPVGGRGLTRYGHDAGVGRSQPGAPTSANPRHSYPPGGGYDCKNTTSLLFRTSCIRRVCRAYWDGV